MGLSYIQRLILHIMNQKRASVHSAIWLAVIEQSLLDAVGLCGKECTLVSQINAVRWFIEGGDDFKAVCDLACVEPDGIRKIAWHAISSTPSGIEIIEFTLNRHLFKTPSRPNSLIASYNEMKRILHCEYRMLMKESFTQCCEHTIAKAF